MHCSGRPAPSVLYGNSTSRANWDSREWDITDLAVWLVATSKASAEVGQRHAFSPPGNPANLSLLLAAPLALA